MVVERAGPRRKPPAVDPRIAQRREEVHAAEARRRRALLVGLVVVVALVGAGFGVTRSAVLDVDHVKIEGAASTPPADIIRAARLARHPAMTDVDPAGARRRLEALPWVARARVVRRWPGTVDIEILERSPAVAVPAPAGGGWLSVDATGRVLAAEPEAPPDLLTVQPAQPPPGPGQRVDTATRGALRVLAVLPKPLDGRVTALAVTGHDLTITIDGHVPVAFGSPTDVGAKLVALTTLLERVDLKGVTGIDVRVPTAPVVQRP